MLLLLLLLLLLLPLPGRPQSDKRSAMGSFPPARPARRRAASPSAPAPTTSLRGARSGGEWWVFWPRVQSSRQISVAFKTDALPSLHSYVAALELRIEKLSRRLTFAKSRMASVSHHESEPAPLLPPPDRKDSLALIKAAIHRKAAKTRENLDVTSLVSDFGFL
jgi:uncharacterized coiled-coil protein SlyX